MILANYNYHLMNTKTIVLQQWHFVTIQLWCYMKPSSIHIGKKDLTCSIREIQTSFTKGQLISKCLFGVFSFSQKTKENKSTRGIIILKLIFFVRFLGNWGFQKVLLKLTDLYLKMEYLSIITIFGLKMMIKSGLENYFWNSSMGTMKCHNSFSVVQYFRIFEQNY